MPAETIPEAGAKENNLSTNLVFFTTRYRSEINPVTGQQRLYRDITDQMIWDWATQQPCRFCKLSNDKGEPNTIFSRCQLCKHSHSDFFTEQDAPADSKESAGTSTNSQSVAALSEIVWDWLVENAVDVMVDECDVNILIQRLNAGVPALHT